MCPADRELRVTVRALDGAVLRQLSVSIVGPASAVLNELSRLALDARRSGALVSVEDAPGAIASLLRICGLASPVGPIDLGRR